LHEATRSISNSQEIKTEMQSGTHPTVCSHDALIVPHNEQKEGSKENVISMET
jgi:hypothetical protein